MRCLIRIRFIRANVISCSIFFPIKRMRLVSAWGSMIHLFLAGLIFSVDERRHVVLPAFFSSFVVSSFLLRCLCLLCRTSYCITDCISWSISTSFKAPAIKQSAPPLLNTSECNNKMSRWWCERNEPFADKSIFHSKWHLHCEGGIRGNEHGN